MKYTGIALACCAVSFGILVDSPKLSAEERSPRHNPEAANADLLVYEFGEGDMFRLALAQRSKRQGEWREALRKIEDPDAFSDATSGWREGWKLEKHHNLLLPEDYELSTEDSGLQLKGRHSGRVIDISPLLPRNTKSAQFTRRLGVAESEEWTVVAICNDVPSNIDVRCINSKHASATFSFTSTCLTLRSLLGRHYQVFSLAISDGRLEIYSASTAGVNIDVVSLDSGASVLRFAVATSRE